MKLLWLINERYRYYVLKRSILTITDDLIVHKIDFLLDLVDNKNR